MVNVVGGLTGTKGKGLTYGLTITGAVGKVVAGRSVREKERAKKDLKKVRKDFKKKHDIEKGQLDQEALVADATKFVTHSAKLFFYEALIAKREFGQIEEIGNIIVDIEKYLKKIGGKKKLKKIKDLDQKLLLELGVEGGNIKSELKALFGLERTAKGNTGVEFLFKKPPAAVFQKWLMRREFKNIARDESRIEGNKKSLENLRDELVKGKVNLNKEVHKIEGVLETVIKEVHDEIKNSHKLVFNNWMNMQLVLGVLNGDIELTAELAEHYEIPRAMAALNKENVQRVLIEANKNLNEEQTIMNQLHRKEQEAEAALRKAA